MDVAIIICTHRRPGLLADAIQSLVEQQNPPDAYEVIVVDNDVVPNSDVQKIVENAQEKIPIHYAHESKIGLSYARNKGVKESSAEYICYIDDDAKVNSRYLDVLFGVIKAHKPDICGGPFYPFYQTRKPAWFIDEYGSGLLGDNARYLTQKEYLSGMNIVFKRSLLCKLGGFKTCLGMYGGKMWYGEETKLMIDAWEVNPQLKVYYEPDLLVYHLVPSSKMTLINILKTAFLKGKSQAYFWIPKEQVHTARLHAPFVIIMDLFRLFYRLLEGIVFLNRHKYPHWQNFVVEEISPSVTTLGSNLRLAQDLLFQPMNHSCDS